MTEPDRRYGADLANLMNVAIGFAAVGTVVVASGVAVLLHAAKGGTGVGVFGVLTGSSSLYIAGRAFWGYRHLKKNPQIGRGLDSPPLLVDPGRPYRARLFYTGLALVAGGAAVAYVGGSILAGSMPYSTTVGILAVIAAIACFFVAGSYFWKVYKKSSQVIR